jgi:autotransporter-associated beta strand protein
MIGFHTRQPLPIASVIAALLCVILLLTHSSARAANEAVTVTTVSGGDSNDGVFANASGTPTNGYTVRVAIFSETQAEVLSLSYNSAWVENRMSVFGQNVTAAQGSAPPLDGSFGYDLVNTSDAFKNKQAWLVYSTGSDLTDSASYGVVTSTDSSWVIANASPWQTTLNINDIDRVGYGSTDSLTSYTGTVRVAADPTALYWDSNDGAGLGGDGTWSTTSTEWTTNSGGVGASNTGTGPYAWGTTSAGNYDAGAGLKAHFNGTAGAVTVSGTVQVHNGLSFDPSTGSYTLSSGTINLAGSSAAANEISVATGDTTYIASALTGSNGMTKAGAGTLTLNGTNTYTGATIVSGGTLQANAANSLQSTTSINITSGDSLLVSASNAVNDSAAINLEGGTLALSGNNRSDVMGALTLTSNSVIDMGEGTGNVWLSFNNLAQILTPTTQLNIWNYTFGVDHIYFHGSTTEIGNATSLANVNFYSGAGTGFLSNGFLSGPELHSAVVPEPEVYATAVLLLLGFGVHYYRQKRRPAPVPVPLG